MSLKLKLFFAITVAGVILPATVLHAQFSSSQCDCPIPVGDTGITVNPGRQIPPFIDHFQRVSPDEKNLVFETAIAGQDNAGYFINLSSLQRNQITCKLPGESLDWVAPRFFWCPYDSDLVAVESISMFDTSNNGMIPTYVDNLITYRISTGESKIITPNILIPNGQVVELLDWRHLSHPGADTFEIFFNPHGSSDSVFYGLYIPQTQSLIPFPISSDGDPVDTSVIAVSRDGLHILTGTYDTMLGSSRWWVALDGDSLRFPIPAASMHNASFSPDGKRLALSIDPEGEGGGTALADSLFTQVWIYNVDNPDPGSVHVINFQCCFCKYNFGGIFAEFLTDSTLAVSMHKDGDESSPLYEISINGCNIVRQLTFLPEYPSGIVSMYANSASTLRVFPNPASSTLQIMGAQSGEVHLFDLLGREVLTPAPLPEGEGIIDVSHLAEGMYFLRSGTQSATVEIMH
jgi:hypothetical protein